MRGFILATAALALTACASMEMEETAASGIAARASQFEAAFNAGDAAGVAALYTPDATLMPPGGATIEGREGINALWQGYVDAGLDDIDLITVEIADHGDSATELGRFTITAPDGKGGRVTVAGKYIVLWARGEDGVWWLHWDIWNNDPA